LQKKKKKQEEEERNSVATFTAPAAYSKRVAM
jgi:hypothetical protein